MILVYIYGLVDPQNEHVYYVGATINPEMRFGQHVYSARGGVPNAAIVVGERTAQIIKAGFRPVLKILETTSKRKAIKAEQHWISVHRKTTLNKAKPVANGKGRKLVAAFFVNKKERKVIRAHATEAGMSVSEFLRRLVMETLT